MVTVTIPKREYQRLLDRALRYQYVQSLLSEDIFVPPPTKRINSILKELQGTKRYSKAFLQSLERGLKRSSYFQQ